MTATAKQEVVNAAMAHMGEPPFDDIAADPPSATLAKVLAQLEGRAGVEQWALSRHPWLCALAYAELTPMGSPPANWKWQYTFLLPDTFIKLWALDGVAADTPYEVGVVTDGGAQKKVLRCNLGAVKVSYTERKPFEAYTPDLCNVMALKLASRSMGPVKSDYEGARRLDDLAARALFEAQGGEAGQHHDDEAILSSGLSELRATIP